MAALLKLTLAGIKNIEEPLSLEFSNQSIERIGEGINKTKGIFGYNGSGKSALVSALYLYKALLLSQNFLLQNQTQEYLEETINRKTKRFEVSLCFLSEGKILRHDLSLGLDDASSSYLIKRERLTFLKGRTLNEGGEVLLSKESPSCQSLILSCLEEKKESLGKKERCACQTLLFASRLSVYLPSENLPKLGPFKESLFPLLRGEALLEGSNPAKEKVRVSDYPSYEKANKALKRFIVLFKPSLLEIRLIKTLEGDCYHVRKEFVYEDYAIDLEHESSGIKQLVSLYAYLKSCSKGGIAFIDEIDANLNTAYFKKLIAYFQNYGKGQLVFTTHNVEAMDVLKKAKRGIEVLGSNGKAYTWVARGNRSPLKEYLDGYIPYSPLNIEDFDFIKVFQNEEGEL